MIIINADARPGRADERGTALLSSLCTIVVAAGLCAAMMVSVTSRAGLVRTSRDVICARDLADAGLAAARYELQLNQDLNGDGLGSTQRSFGNGKFIVTATKLDSTHYKLRSTGHYDRSRQTLESVEEVTSSTSSGLNVAAFGKSWVLCSGGTVTDAYDSSLGAYATQATHIDANGVHYAQFGGDLGSNGTVTLGGSGTVIVGNATPGVSSSCVINGGAVVDGSTAPEVKPVSVPPVDTTPVIDPVTGLVLASAKNYGVITKSGSASISAAGDINIGNGGVMTIPSGTFYINTLKMTNGSTLNINGDVNLYLAHSFDASNGAIANPSNIPSKFHLYGLGNENVTNTDVIRISVKNGLSAVIYAPDMGFVTNGGGAFYGAVVADTVKDTGGAAFHFDVQLKNKIGSPTTTYSVHQVSWRRVGTPESLASY